MTVVNAKIFVQNSTIKSILLNNVIGGDKNGFVPIQSTKPNSIQVQWEFYQNINIYKKSDFIDEK